MPLTKQWLSEQVQAHKDNWQAATYQAGFNEGAMMAYAKALEVMNAPESAAPPVESPGDGPPAEEQTS